MARKHSKLFARASRFPIYLWIAGVYPILHLYAENFGLVRDSEAAHALIAMLAATTLVYLVAKPIEGNPHKRAFYLCIASLSFSTSGHLYSLFVMPRSLLVWDIASAIVVVAIIVACARFIRPHSYALFTRPLNLVAASLLLMQIISLLGAWADSQRFIDANSLYSQAWEERPSAQKIMDSADRPDIYYIVPDGYPSDAQLSEDMNFDNSAFTEALRERGFVIAPHAQSNYAVTQLSMASILNMQYYDSNPTSLKDLDHLRLSIANSKVSQMLLRHGYTYVQFVSQYMLPSPIADINRDFGIYGPIDIALEDTIMPATMPQERLTSQIQVKDGFTFRQPFTPMYIDSTGLRIVRSQLEKLRLAEKLVPYTAKSAQRFLDTIDEVETIAAMPEATFAVIHLMQPHTPVNFNENGDIIEQTIKPSPAEFYADLRYSNSQFLRMIDIILQDSASEPIIVFQADHGSHFGHGWSKGRRPTNFNVYAAYYLPEPFAIEIPRPFTLVNSFTFILNEVFATGHDLQPDRLYESVGGYGMPFQQVDVTEEFLHR